AEAAAAKERAGEKPRESSESLNRKAADLDVRLEARREVLDRQAHMSPKPPHILTAALVVPSHWYQSDSPYRAY
ncbi:hypothetical protein ACFQ07_18175, partial [Actinomadura adrarensis]